MTIFKVEMLVVFLFLASSVCCAGNHHHDPDAQFFTLGGEDFGSDYVGAFVRIAGLEIDTVLFAREPADNAWRARYRLCSVGNYSAAVYIYMRARTPEAVLVDRTVCARSIDAPVRTFTWFHNYSCGGNNISSWRWHQQPAEEENGLARYIVPARPDYALAYADLRRHDPLGPADLAALVRLVQKERVCLYGDSQMRNLLNSIGGQLLPQTCFPLLQQKYKGDCDVPGFAWRGYRFPYQWTYDAEMPHCAHVLVNFGQWPLSDFATTDPWDLKRYRMAVRAELRRFMRLRPKVRSLTWVSTNPHPLGRAQRTCPATDWRFPHLIASFNHIAHAEVLRSPGIGWLDTYAIAFPLSDLSFDGAHYQGPVGIALAHALAHHLLALGRS